MATEIEGYAALFDVETTIAGLFRERISPGAFRDTIARDDVRGLFNHDPNIVLGRKTAGPLRLREDSKGLRYTARLNPDDPLAVSVGARVKRRDVTGSSSWFAIDDPSDEEWEPPAIRGGLPLRTLRKLRLIDVSPVTFPAYIWTSAAARDAGLVPLELARLRLRIVRAWSL
jgi:HK97 family phage prohead protease